jgi:hypothetical protein
MTIDCNGDKIYDAWPSIVSPENAVIVNVLALLVSIRVKLIRTPSTATAVGNVIVDDDVDALHR